MKFKKIIPALALGSMAGIPMAMSTSSCARLHIHTFTSDYEHDETHHWKTCKICHERFDYAEHVFNPLNNKCLICGYEDPLVITNDSGTMLGMTEYGKTKLTFDVPHSVTDLIEEGAFLGSKAITVKINKECKGYHKNALKNVKIITYEVEDPQLTEEGDYIMIGNVFDASEARVGNTYYATLKEAIESTTIGDITVTLLRENIEETDPEPIKVTHSVTLVSYYSSCNLKCNFDIGGAGIVYIPETVHYYDSTARLLLSDYTETRGTDTNAENGNTTDSVYNTGSLVFTHKKTAPLLSDNVKVSYVKTFQSGAVGWEAVGSYQVANTLLILPVDNYAYGTFRFSKDFKEIKGLTLYGETVSELHVTNVIKGINATIGQNAFTVAWKICIEFPSLAGGDIWLNFFRTKGFFFDVCIDDGITSIGTAAFSCHFKSNGRVSLDDELTRWLPIVFSHLFSVKIGDSVTEIGTQAFRTNVSLETVSGGKNLTTIGNAAFYKCFNLISADFSQSTALKTIGKNAFSYDKELLQVILPKGTWKTSESSTYFPYNFSPERFATGLKKDSDKNEAWTKSDDKFDKVAYTQSTSTDDYGWFKDVAYTDSVEYACSHCADGGEIYLSEDFTGSYAFDLSSVTKFNKGITFNADKSLSNITINPNDGNKLTIPKGSYVALSNVEPTGKDGIVLMANDSADLKTYAGSAGVAIEGLDPSITKKIEDKIYLKNNNGNEVPAKGSVASVRDVNYDAFGLFDFTLEDTADDKPITTINDISTLGRTASSIVFDSQIIEDTPSDIIIDHNGGQSLTGSSNITNITLADSVKTIADNFFHGFAKLRELTVGEGLESIGKSAFDADYNLSQVVLNGQLKTIGESAFHGCSSLWLVNFPDDNNLQQIGAKAFEGCRNLSAFHFGNNINNWVVDADVDPIYLEPEILADDYIAALYLTRDTKDEDIGYMSKTWTRVGNI